MKTSILPYSISVLLIAVSLPPCSVQAQENSHERAATPLTIVHEKDRRVEIHSGNGLLLRYVHSPLEFGHPHFHPLHTPAGILTTRSAPADHIWHNGLWFSWKFINGENFWEGPSPVSRETQIVPLALENVTATASGAGFSAKYLFRNRAGTAVLEQTLDAEVHAPAQEDTDYAIDLTYTFRPVSGDVTFGVVPYDAERLDWGGYAGLTYRPFEQQHYIYSNADGGEAVNGAGDLRWKKSRWIDFSIPADGFPTRWVGVSLMDHPGNIRFPAANNIAPRSWHWNWMQLSLLFEGEHVLPQGETLTLRYRVVVRDGRLDRSRVDRLWAEFAGETPKSE